MISAKPGYTLIEVMIVVSVIGILAAIVTVSWNGVVTNNRNNLRAQDINHWSATFDTYKGRYSAYPIMPTATTAASAEIYCLGAFTDFGGKCGAYTTSPTTATTTIPTEVAKIGKVPTNNIDLVVGNKLIGPILAIYKNGTPDVTVTAQIINFFENTCPAGLVDVSSAYPAQTMLTAANVSGAKACKLNPDKTFTYTP